MKPDINLKVVVCDQCNCRFGISSALYEVATCSEDITFYCPYGHNLMFPKTTKVLPEKKDNIVQLHIVKKEENDA